jgi:hypothetical protein
LISALVRLRVSSVGFLCFSVTSAFADTVSGWSRLSCPERQFLQKRRYLSGEPEKAGFLRGLLLQLNFRPTNNAVSNNKFPYAINSVD